MNFHMLRNKPKRFLIDLTVSVSMFVQAFHHEKDSENWKNERINGKRRK